MLPSVDLEDRISHPDPQVQTHHKTPLTDPYRCYDQRPRPSRHSSYPLSTNFSHQLKINMHCKYMEDQQDNTILKALVSSYWGEQKEILLLTYKALVKSIASYAALMCTNASDSRLKKIQTAQNLALRTATEAHMMDIIEHLHQESLKLKVNDLSDIISVQYLVNCLEENHVCHGITTQEPRLRPMKETLHSRHYGKVELVGDFFLTFTISTIS